MEKIYVCKSGTTKFKKQQEKDIKDFAEAYPKVRAVYVNWEYYGYDKHYFLVCIFKATDLKPAEKAKLNGENRKGYLPFTYQQVA